MMQVHVHQMACNTLYLHIIFVRMHKHEYRSQQFQLKVYIAMQMLAFKIVKQRVWQKPNTPANSNGHSITDFHLQLQVKRPFCHRHPY